MSSTTKQLEARLTRVEKELAAIKASLAKRNSARWYREIVGDFADDKAHREIVRLGRLIRSGKLKD
jgi:hypothetical protein